MARTAPALGIVSQALLMQAFVHGACLVFLDGLGAGSSGGGSPRTIHERCMAHMASQIGALLGNNAQMGAEDLEVRWWETLHHARHVNMDCLVAHGRALEQPRRAALVVMVAQLQRCASPPHTVARGGHWRAPTPWVGAGISGGRLQHSLRPSPIGRDSVLASGANHIAQRAARAAGHAAAEAHPAGRYIWKFVCKGRRCKEPFYDALHLLPRAVELIFFSLFPVQLVLFDVL